MNDNEQKEIFSKNLNAYLEASRKTQKEAANAIGVSPQTFNTWCKGIALPRMGKVQKLADYFHISKSDLIDSKTYTASQRVESILIPVFEHIRCEASLTDPEYIVSSEVIPLAMASEGNYFALKLTDNSMMPRFFAGDIVIALRQNTASSNDIIIALTTSTPFAILRKYIEYDGGCALLPLNPAHEPLLFSCTDPEHTPFQIIGKAVKLHAKL